MFGLVSHSIFCPYIGSQWLLSTAFFFLIKSSFVFCGIKKLIQGGGYKNYISLNFCLNCTFKQKLLALQLRIVVDMNMRHVFKVDLVK